MGTRSLTFVHDNAWDGDDPLATEAIVCIYQQYDGYFDGVGEDIKGFLAGAQMVNGIGMNDGVTQFNGAGDLAARLITHFKRGDENDAGGVYVESPTLNDGDMGVEYVYHIYPGDRSGQEPYLRAVGIYSGVVVEGPASEVVLAETYDEDD